MRFPAKHSALLLTALALVCTGAGCTSAHLVDTAPLSSPETPASQDATAEARAALEDLFTAWESKDAAGADAAIAEDRRGGEWEFADVDRIEFGTIIDSPEDVPGYMANGLGSSNGVSVADVRAFRATITYFYKPGREGVMQDGEAASYMWFVERRPSGEWLVTDWGY